MPTSFPTAINFNFIVMSGIVKRIAIQTLEVLAQERLPDRTALIRSMKMNYSGWPLQPALYKAGCLVLMIG